MLLSIFSLKKRILVIAVNGLTNSRKILQYHSERHFQPELLKEESINMLKILSFRFQQCFLPFTMLLLEGSSKIGLFRHLSNHVFRSPYVQKYICYGSVFFFENVQNQIEIQKIQKKKNKKKMEKKSFVCEIIASENVAINWHC